MRRSLLRLLAIGGFMTGDGLVAPVNAPPAYALPPGVQPGVSPGVVTANRVIVFGPSSAIVGVFVYQPGTTPGAGNPPIAWMTSASTDPFGNTLVVAGGGIGTQSGAGRGWVDMQGADLFFAPAGAGSTLAGQIATATGGVSLVSPKASITDTAAFLQLTAAPAGSVPTAFLDAALTATSGTPGTPTLVTTDSWHAMTLANGWANDPGFVPASYRLSADGKLEIAGTLRQAAAPTSPVIGTAGTAAPYLPSVPGVVAAFCSAGVNAGSSSGIEVDAAGNVTLVGFTVGANPIVGFHGELRLT